MGDPIEVEALSRVFQHKSGYRTLIGSLKTNLGHSEAVSGITSVIKVVLALEHQLIPPTIDVKQVNPQIELDKWNVEIVTQPRQWPSGTRKRASINSFGFGGANAHVILEAASLHVPGYREITHFDTQRIGHRLILPFSAHNDRSLEARVLDLAEHNIAEESATNLAYTLSSRRSNLHTRGYLLAGSDSLKHDLTLENLRRPEASLSKLPLAFIFTGQGAQWSEMGQALMQFTTYKRAIEDLDSCLSYLSNAPSWTIKGQPFDAFSLVY